ncbi:MAG TPA: hypothetical protein VIW29_17965 [Polyangiaceae bacterium]
MSDKIWGGDDDDMPAIPDSKDELAAEAAQTRELVAEDIEALKGELTVERLKDRALDAAERSMESVALRALRRLALAPRALVSWGRRHPAAVAGTAGASLALLLWRARSRRSHGLFS